MSFLTQADDYDQGLPGYKTSGWIVSLGRRSCILLLCLAFLVVSLQAVTPARGNMVPEFSREDGIKAAFIYTFGKFVQWPAIDCPIDSETKTPFYLCIIGDISQKAKNALRYTLEGKMLKARPVIFWEYGSGDEIRPCNMLFIGGMEQKSLAAILQQAKAHHVLTISDMEGFTEQGGIIALYKDQNKIRFKINLTAAQEAGLSLSSKLLSLAVIVKNAN